MSGSVVSSLWDHTLITTAVLVMPAAWHATVISAVALGFCLVPKCPSKMSGWACCFVQLLDGTGIVRSGAIAHDIIIESV